MTWIYHNIDYCYVGSRVRMAMVSMNVMMVSMAVLGTVLYLQVTFVVEDFFLDLFAFPVLFQMWFLSLMIQESGAKAAALSIVPVICVLLYMFEDLDYTQILFLANISQFLHNILWSWRFFHSEFNLAISVQNARPTNKSNSSQFFLFWKIFTNFYPEGLPLVLVPRHFSGFLWGK